MTGPGTDGFLPLRPGHAVYILGKKVRGMFTWTGVWGQTMGEGSLEVPGPLMEGPATRPHGVGRKAQGSSSALGSYMPSSRHPSLAHVGTDNHQPCLCLLPVSQAQVPPPPPPLGPE